MNVVPVLDGVLEGACLTVPHVGILGFFLGFLLWRLLGLLVQNLAIRELDNALVRLEIRLVLVRHGVWHKKGSGRGFLKVSDMLVTLISFDLLQDIILRQSSFRRLSLGRIHSTLLDINILLSLHLLSRVISLLRNLLRVIDGLSWLDDERIEIGSLVLSDPNLALGALVLEALHT